MHGKSTVDPISGSQRVDDLDDRIFRAHFENLPGPAFIWQRTGDDFRLIAHNRAGAAIGGNELGAFVGVSARELYADRPELFEDLRACAHGIVIRREYPFRFDSGDIRILNGTCLSLSGDRVVVHVEDVTERRAAVLALEQSEARLRALYQSNPDVVFRMDAEGRFLDLHVPDSRALPWSREELIGRTVADFYGEDAGRYQAMQNRRAISTGKVQVFEYKAPLGDRIAILESRVACAGDNEVVVSVRDISDRVDLEHKLTVAGERERNRIGHDIHDGLAQMLTGVKLMVENLERKLIDEGSRHSGDASRAATLINETIIQARELVRGLSPIPDGTTLFGGLRLLAQHAEKYLGVVCRVELRGDPARLSEAAVAHLYRIAQEAITNAAKHGRASCIDLTCTIDGELVLCVIDDGSGVSELHDHPEGLGLRIMRYRARAIGGDLAVCRRAEGGTVVTCRCSSLSLID